MPPFCSPHLSHRLVLVASGGVAFRGPPDLSCRRRTSNTACRNPSQQAPSLRVPHTSRPMLPCRPISVSTSSPPRVLPPVLQPKKAQACNERSQAGLAKRSRVAEPLPNPRHKRCEEEPTQACAHARGDRLIAVITSSVVARSEAKSEFGFLQ